MSEARPCNVPKYDELSVKNIFPRFQEDEEVMQYMMDSYAKDRYPDRNYYFTVLNTVYPEYVSKMIAHANNQRFAAQGEANKRDVVEINEEWWDKLNKMPFFSRKYNFIRNPSRLKG